MSNLTNLEMIQENLCGFVPWSNGYLCIYLRIIGKITSEEETGAKSFSLQGSNFQTNFQVLLLLLISWIFFSILTVTRITRATENAVTPYSFGEGSTSRYESSQNEKDTGSSYFCFFQVPSGS